MNDPHHQTLHEVDCATLKQWVDSCAARLVDVREPAEFSGEHIPGALTMPLSGFDPAQLPHDPQKKNVLYCRGGNRSGQAGKAVLACGAAEAWHLKGGLAAWKEAGMPVEGRGEGPISMDRQVRIVAGSLVLAGLVLGAFVSPWFLLLSGFVAAGLVFSGVTDFCGMAMLLSKLPYNWCVTKK